MTKFASTSTGLGYLAYLVYTKYLVREKTADRARGYTLRLPLCECNIKLSCIRIVILQQ